MADDVIALLDYVGWTAEHDLHVVGVSMGGMIALGALSQHVHSENPTQDEKQSWPPRYPSALSP